MKETTIIIADDHPLFRSGVRSELENNNHFKILAETGDGKEAYELIQKLKPDIAVLDFGMPGLSGLEITVKLSSSGSNTRVILLTMYRDKKIFYSSLDAGVTGYVLKDDAVSDIVKAVDDVVSGKHFISEKLTQLLIEKAKDNTSDNKTIRLFNNLTPTEKRVLALIADLKSNEEIAGMLFISKRTVENHKVAIAGKLELPGARDLLKFALQNKECIT